MLGEGGDDGRVAPAAGARAKSKKHGRSSKNAKGHRKAAVAADEAEEDAADAAFSGAGGGGGGDDEVHEEDAHHEDGGDDDEGDAYDEDEGAKHARGNERQAKSVSKSGDDDDLEYRQDDGLGDGEDEENVRPARLELVRRLLPSAAAARARGKSAIEGAATRLFSALPLVVRNVAGDPQDFLKAAYRLAPVIIMELALQGAPAIRMFKTSDTVSLAPVAHVFKRALGVPAALCDAFVKAFSTSRSARALVDAVLARARCHGKPNGATNCALNIRVSIVERHVLTEEGELEKHQVSTSGTLHWLTKHSEGPLLGDRGSGGDGIKKVYKDITKKDGYEKPNFVSYEDAVVGAADKCEPKLPRVRGWGSPSPPSRPTHHPTSPQGAQRTFSRRRS